MNIEVKTEHEDMIPELLEIAKRIEKSVQISKSVKGYTQWYTLREAWEFRGGGAWSTFKTNTLLHPRLGVPDGYQQGRRVWARSTIQQWSQYCDDDRLEYIEMILEPEVPEVTEQLKKIAARLDCPENIREFAHGFFSSSLTA